MTPIEKDKIVALCEKWGLKELKLTKGLYLAEDNSGITVNLRGDNPVVGVTIAGELHTEGHGNLKVEDYQREVEAIMKSSSKKSQSSSTEQKLPRSQSGELHGSNPAIKRIDKAQIVPDVKGRAMSGESTLGTPDTSSIAKTQKAICKECKSEFDITLDAAQKTYEEYGAIYCLICRAKEAKHEEKHQETEKRKDAKVEVYKTNTPEIVKTRTSCGLELSGARELECFQKDMRFICEECEDRQKIKGEKIMDEKLPTTINENENKLTVNIIKQYICPAATDAEAYNFLQLCVHRDLNPFLKEAYLIKYGNAPATMVVGKDAFIRKAAESGQYDGFEAGIIIKTSDGRIERRVGVIQYEGDILVGGWAKVHRKDMRCPFVCEVPLNEYMKYKDGKPQSSWAIMPGTMIRKVAVVQGHREAFAKELGGCYDAVEMGTQDNIK